MRWNRSCGEVKRLQIPEIFCVYTNRVCGQIRWKQARPSVERELTNHLLDQRNALIAEGMTEPEAETEAVRRMGDALDLGKQFDSVYRPQRPWGLMILVGILTILGVLCKTFLTSYSAAGDQLIRLAASDGVGVLLLLALYFFGARFIKRNAEALPLILAAVTLCICLLPGRPNVFSFYGRYLTLIFPLAYALFLYVLQGRRWWGIGLAWIGMVVQLVFCVWLSSDTGFVLSLSTSLVLLILCAGQDWFCVGKRRTYISISVFLLILLAAAFLCNRLIGALLPQLSGALHLLPESPSESTGQGMNEFGQDTNYLLTIIVRRLGWPTLIVVFALYFLFFFGGFRCCNGQNCMFAKLSSCSILLSLAIQVLLYGLNALEITSVSVTLPLLSYAPAANIIHLSLTGILFSVFRTERILTDRLKVQLSVS